jgi:seryl-tRNA synthetase
MLDLNRIQNNPDELKQMLSKRFVDDISVVEELNHIFISKKKHQAEVETLRAERNKVSKEIGILKSKGQDITEVSLSMKKVGDRIKEIEELLNKEEEKLLDLNLHLPNFLDDEVPVGRSEEENVEVSKYSTKKEFSFTPQTHFEIGEKLGILDFDKGVKLSGARAYTYFGKAARLERALMNFMLDTHSSENGYTEVWVPLLVNDESMQTTGQYPKFKDEYYRLQEDSLNLIPTAEVPLTNLYRDEIIPDSKLTLSIMAHTSCFRREAGSYGKDTRGLVRVHQFQKVELVKFTRPEESEQEHKKMLSDAESILKKLGLHYRVLLLCSKDTSNSSSKTFDLEVWMPGLNRYMEISSVSNFKDFQARRGKIRYKTKDGKNLLVHTINGSGLAIGRTVAAIMENYQTETGDFEIPEVLKKYF